jgi:hypothetical protein
MLHVLQSGETQAGDRVLRAMFAARKTCLRHAPTPLAANGLDMRIGHPAASDGGSIKQGSHASVPR